MHPSLLQRNSFYAALHSDNGWYRVRLVSFDKNSPEEVRKIHFVSIHSWHIFYKLFLELCWIQDANVETDCFISRLLSTMWISVIMIKLIYKIFKNYTISSEHFRVKLSKHLYQVCLFNQAHTYKINSYEVLYILQWWFIYNIDTNFLWYQFIFL